MEASVKVQISELQDKEKKLGLREQELSDWHE